MFDVIMTSYSPKHWAWSSGILETGVEPTNASLTVEIPQQDVSIVTG